MNEYGKNYEEKLSLNKYNTFAIESIASVCVYINSEEEIKSFYEENGDVGNVFILGGGSNIILPEHIPVVLKINNKGIKVIKEEKNSDGDFVWIDVGAGVVWDEVVKYAVDNNYAGIEMLSAIPGTAGAGPVQNIGAYGGEIKDNLISLRAYDKKAKKFVEIMHDECKFSYRTSIFKTSEKGRYVITSIILKLHKLSEDNKTEFPKIPDYPGVKKYFENLGITNPSLQEVRDAIINIRWSKLPKPSEVPNTGSFFENPIVEKSVALDLINQYKNMPYFNYEDKIKIPAGWLIENAGLKGADFGRVGTYHNNALVLINKGGATQTDVIQAVEKIISTVEKAFKIKLKSEPEIIY